MWLRYLLSLLALACFLYFALCLALLIFQRSLIYYPQARSAPLGASGFIFPIDDTQLFILERPHSGSAAVIYFGGNAEDVANSVPTLDAAFPDQALYLMNYRGYGGSGGKPSEKALVADALALFDKVHTAHPKITVVGRSLGSGIAVQLASQRPAVRLVLVTPYASIEAIAAQQFPYVPVRWLLQDKFESWKFADRVRAPTLLIAAEHDQVIPRASTDTLLEHFQPGVATITRLTGVGHNTIQLSPDYVRLLGAVP